MCRICPKCKSIAEYNAYYGTVICTRCDWESEKLESTSKKYTSIDLVQENKKEPSSKERLLVNN